MNFEFPLPSAMTLTDFEKITVPMFSTIRVYLEICIVE